MATYNLERLGILVADGNRFTRILLRGVLRSFGIEQIEIVNNGAEAIERLKSARNNADEGSQFDIVLSDSVMPAVDGLMLLRWLRQTKASPNRFMPFMMFSSDSNRDAVLAARDAGAHEFIAKPFSPEILSSHILALIDRPRPFIYCGSYFGPDRRREAHRFDGTNRRVMGEDEVQIVYANREPTPLREGGPKVWRFRPPNKLRAKIGGAAPGETGAIDPAMLEAADDQIGQMEDDYADWVKKSIGDLTAAVERCRAIAESW